jgi:soluble P-type ATPase
MQNQSLAKPSGMIPPEKIEIPGWGSIRLKQVVLDLNGTITESGRLIPGVQDYIRRLVDAGLKVFVLSGDTRGNVQGILGNLPECQVRITKTAPEKRNFVESIGPDMTVTIGNGNIDVEMFKTAALSICTMQGEGAATQAMLHADIVVTHICQAFEIVLDPAKLIATLRA